MSRSVLSRLSLSATIALVIGLAGLSQSATAAEPPALTVTADKQSATPGSSVTLTMTFTNVQTTDVQFVYQTIHPTYDTTKGGLKYAFTSCTEEGKPCDATRPLNYTVPIAPGATRTVKLTYQVAADSTCGANKAIGFYSYLYYEFAAGQSTKDGIFPTGLTNVPCATNPTPAGAGHQ